MAPIQRRLGGRGAESGTSADLFFPLIFGLRTTKGRQETQGGGGVGATDCENTLEVPIDTNFGG